MAVGVRRLGRREEPVPVFATHFPVVAYAQARADSPRTQAVYAISRRLDDVLQLGRDGNVV